MIKLTNKVIIVALTGIICVSVGCFSAKVRMDPLTHTGGKPKLYPGLAYDGAADGALEQVWRVGDFPLSFAVDTAMLPFDAIAMLVTRDNGKAAAEEAAAKKTDEAEAAAEAAKKAREEGIDAIKSAGITEKNATILYDAGLKFPDPLGEGNATQILDGTPEGTITMAEAKEIAEAAKDEKTRLDKLARIEAEDKKTAAVEDFMVVVGIKDGDATRIYDDEENGFQTFDDLKDANSEELIAAGLADDDNVETLMVEITVAAKKIAKARATAATKAAEDAQSKFKEAKDRADEAAKDAADAAKEAADKKEKADSAQENADAARKIADDALKAFPPLKKKEKTPEQEKTPPAIESPDKNGE